MAGNVTPDAYKQGYELGSDSNYAAYYANGAGDFFAAGFVDGRLSLYERIENDSGVIRDEEKRESVMDALYWDGVWGAIREIEKQEEG